MNCTEAREELVAYERGELSPADGEHVARHVEGCEACAAELESLRAALATVREGLVTIEPRADFRVQLSEAVVAEGEDRRSSASQRRFLTLRCDEGEERSGWRNPLKGRYLGASILLHAAIFLMVVGIPVAVHVSRSSTDVEKARVKIDLPRYRVVFAERQRARRSAARLAVGLGRRLTVDALPAGRGAAAFYFAGDPVDKCIWAYPVGGEGAMSEAALLSEIPADARFMFTRVAVSDGSFSIPEKLAESYLGSAPEVVVLDLLGSSKRKRLEIWDPARLESYMAELTAAALRVWGFSDRLLADCAVLLRFQRRRRA